MNVSPQSKVERSSSTYSLTVPTLNRTRLTVKTTKAPFYGHLERAASITTSNSSWQLHNRVKGRNFRHSWWVGRWMTFLQSYWRAYAPRTQHGLGPLSINTRKVRRRKYSIRTDRQATMFFFLVLHSSSMRTIDKRLYKEKYWFSARPNTRTTCSMRSVVLQCRGNRLLT